VAGATVSIDGKNVGATPLPNKLLIDAGEHRIVIVKDGYSNGERSTSLAGGDDVAIELSLTEAATPQLAGSAPSPPAATLSAPAPTPTQPAPTPDRTPPAVRQSVWPGWFATTTLGLAAAGFGAATLVSARDLDDKKSSHPATSPEDIRSAADRTRV